MEDGFEEEIWEMLCNDFAGRNPPKETSFSKHPFLPPAIVAHQEKLSLRAAKRFSTPKKWLWTSKLLEQASDQQSAGLLASNFPQEALVFDLCCGAGADSVALARRGPVVAIDQSPIAAALARANLALNGLAGSVRCENVSTVSIPSEAWVHIDPDRRSTVGRTTSLDFFEPGRDFLVKLISRTKGGSIKVAPATKLEDFADQDAGTTDRASALCQLGRQFVSLGGSVRQQRWWWNTDRFQPRTTTISIGMGNDAWFHWAYGQQDPPANLRETLSDRDELSRFEGCFLGDADGAVRAAGLQAELANEMDVLLLGSRQGYFLTEELARTESSPLIDWFRIESIMAFDRKKIRAYLRKKQIGKLEIKTRSVDVSVEQLRHELKLDGDESRTLLISKCSNRTVAFIAQRITQA